MKSKRLWIALVVLLVVVIGIVVWQQQQPAQQEEKVIKIGAILPLTGPVSIIGQWHKRGMEMAVEEINQLWKNEKRKLIVIYEDSKNDAKEGVNAFSKMTRLEKVPLVISAMSRVSMPLLPLANQNEIILFLTDVTYPNITLRSEWVFRYFLASDIEARAMAPYALKNLGVKKIALLYLNDEAGKGAISAFRKEFERLGGVILAEESYELTEINLRNHLQKLVQQKPQALWIYGVPSPSYGSAIRQARELGFIGLLLTNQAMAFPISRKIAGDASEGVYFTMPNIFSSNKAGEFVKEYKNKWGEDPGLEAFYGYDIIKIIALAMERIKNDKISSSIIRSQLYSIKDFDGTFGKISIGKDRDIRVPLTIAVIKNNTVVLANN